MSGVLHLDNMVADQLYSLILTGLSGLGTDRLVVEFKVPRPNGGRIKMEVDRMDIRGACLELVWSWRFK